MQPSSPQRITSAHNPLVQHLKKLADKRSYRRERGEFLCDGFKLLEEALRSGAEITALLFAEGAALPPLPEGVRTAEVPAGLLASVSPSETPQGVVFSCRMAERSLPEAGPGSYLVLDGVQDPGNVGTILRTADAFACDGVFLLPGCADPWGPKTVRASMGALFRQPFWEVSVEELTAFLSASGVPLLAAVPGGDAVEIQKASLRPAAVVIGSEGQGVSPQMLAISAGRVHIPMKGNAESLNAAVAAALVLWETAR